MASDSLGGVVDINSKVFGLHNMYVAGSSIFPSCDWVNPTLNLTTMTARLADHLVRKDAGKINTMVFKDGSQKMDGLSNGWSTPEMEGTWSDGNQAEINITASGARELILRGRPYADTQVTMVVNGRKVYAGPCGGLLNTIFQLDGQPELNIVFTFTNLTTPESLGENDDTRELGLFLTELQIR